MARSPLWAPGPDPVKIGEFEVVGATLTTWNMQGVQTSTRQLSQAEIDARTPPPPPPNPAADQLEAAAQSAEQAALEDVRALAPLLQAAADALRSA